MKLLTYLKAQRGRARELAKAIGCRPPDVSLWAYGKRPVPPRRCIAIEQATGGAITRADLRPDDWPLLWPEYTPPRKRRARAA